MQHLDVDGQAAMARVLKRMNSAETTIVIAHGLASDALYGEFEAIDVVEKRGDVSEVRVAGVGAGPPTRSRWRSPPCCGCGNRASGPGSARRLRTRS